MEEKFRYSTRVFWTAVDWAEKSTRKVIDDVEI